MGYVGPLESVGFEIEKTKINGSQIDVCTFTTNIKWMNGEFWIKCV